MEVSYSFVSSLLILKVEVYWKAEISQFHIKLSIQSFMQPANLVRGYAQDQTSDTVAVRWPRHLLFLYTE